MKLTICIRRYHIIPAVVSVIIFVVVCTFSSHEKKWHPYTAALTFDDGPHPFYTRTLLDILSAHDVPATFFLVGTQIDKYPDLAQTISREGHECGNHTYTHKNLTKLSDPMIAAELIKTHTALTAATGKKPMWFRPPGGNFNKRVIDVARKLDYRIAMWEVNPKDLVPQDADELIRYILDHTTDNTIILLHSGVDTTVICLPQIIQGLKARGFRFVTVSEIKSLSKKTETAYF